MVNPAMFMNFFISVILGETKLTLYKIKESKGGGWLNTSTQICAAYMDDCDLPLQQRVKCFAVHIFQKSILKTGKLNPLILSSGCSV